MPREVHEQWTVNPEDPDDRTLAGVTVVVRESPWDDESRQKAIDLIEYEESLCHCGCGLPREVAWKKQPFMVHEAVCYAGKAIAELQEVHRKKHEQTGDYEAFMRGRHYFAAPAKEPNPDD